MMPEKHGATNVRRILILALFLVGAAVSLISASKPQFTTRNKAYYYANPAGLEFIRPGLVIKVNSAEIAADGTITTVFTISDPKGAPLDREGVVTPGTISLSFVAAYIPKEEEQYVAYTTRPASGAAVAMTTQAAADSGGTYTKLADGQYRYRFNTRAPATFDRTVTHTIGIYGSRNLSEFDLGTDYASTTFNFVPDGTAVVTTRDVIRTASCNKCHDQLSAHGGSRRGMEMCVLCHTPQTLDPDTGNTVDMKVMIHKIHAGAELPSVQAGRPYRIVGFQGAVTDWSTVVFPSDVRRCESCHEQNTGAAEPMGYLTDASREACGSCHDNVNFATGENHVNLPQISDNQCTTCHIPQGELEFDASIKGAHTIPTESAMLKGLVVEIVKVDDGVAGKKPAVTFSVKDKSGAGIPLNQLNNVSLLMAGPTRDYGYTSFGSDVTTPGYVSESAMGASCAGDGTCMYTFQRAIPGNATGSYSIGIEARRTETLLPGTTKQMQVQYGAVNKVVHFSVDGSPLQPRRTVVETRSCNQCHTFLSLHGNNRNEVAMCVLCHNPSQTDSARRPTAQDPNDRTQPPQGVNFALLIHRIHTGERLQEEGKSFVVVGFGGSHNDFSEVHYPAMSPQGTTGDTRYCAMCHVNGSEQTLPTGLNSVTDPQGLINPVMPVTSACTGCHVSTPAASHALVNTSGLGESCEVCHKSTADFAVSKVHAQY